MKAERIATRMSVLGRALPSRVLLVDDDELELELMADRLSAAGFEVACAPNGEAALQLIEQQWYCLLYTSDAADERSSVDLGGRRNIKQKMTKGAGSALVWPAL